MGKLALILLAFGLTAACVRSEQSRGYGGGTRGRADNPFEPTVSRTESLLLQQALEVAATNRAEAIALLTAGDLRNASAALDYAAGNLYFQADRLEEAAAAYRVAIEKLPTFRRAILNLGRVHLARKRTSEAIALYQQLVADGQADADMLLLLGHALLMENAPVSAESAYRQALLLQPKAADAMLGLAKALLRQDRFAEGLALVSEILEIEPTRWELWALRANACLSAGKEFDAMRTLEQARRLGCAEPELLATLGDLLLRHDRPEDALAAYDAAFAVEAPSVQRMLRAVEGFLLLDDAESAAEMMARVDAVRERRPEAFDGAAQVARLRLQAELARRTGRIAEARALCGDVLEQDPLDGRTLLLLARLHASDGQLEDAVLVCERAARVQGFEADALALQARIEVQRERYDRAMPLLEAAQTFEARPHVARYLEQLRRMAER